MVTRNSKEYEILKKRLKVSPEDADLLQNKWSIYDGYPKGTINRLYYARRAPVIDGRQVKMIMHRVIMERMLGRKLSETEKVDHINWDGLDNRRENLQILTHGQNIGRGRLRRINKSGVQGVHWCVKNEVWIAQITANKRVILIGRYKDKFHAMIAYDAVANLVRGKHYTAQIFAGERPIVLTREHFSKYIE